MIFLQRGSILDESGSATLEAIESLVSRIDEVEADRDRLEVSFITATGVTESGLDDLGDDITGGHILQQNGVDLVQQRDRLNARDGLNAIDTSTASVLEVDEAFDFQWTGAHKFQPLDPNETPVFIQAASGQFGDLFRIRDFAGTQMVVVDNDGLVEVKARTGADIPVRILTNDSGGHTVAILEVGRGASSQAAGIPFIHIQARSQAGCQMGWEDNSSLNASLGIDSDGDTFMHLSSYTGVGFTLGNFNTQPLKFYMGAPSGSFRLDATGNVGFNEAAPIFRTHHTENGSCQSAWDSVGASVLIGRSSGGSTASRTATPNSQTIFSFNARGHDGAAFTSARADMRAISAELFTPTNQGTRFVFRTTPTGSTTIAEVFSMEADGGIRVTNLPSEGVIGTDANGQLIAGSVAAFNLEDLNNVNTGANADGDLLIWDSVSAQWKSEQTLDGLYVFARPVTGLTSLVFRSSEPGPVIRDWTLTGGLGGLTWANNGSPTNTFMQFNCSVQFGGSISSPTLANKSFIGFNSSGVMQSSYEVQTVTVGGSTGADPDKGFISCRTDTAASNMTIVLPLAATSGVGKIFIIKNDDRAAADSGFTVTVATGGSDTFDGRVATFPTLLSTRRAVTFVSDGVATWIAVSLYTDAIAA